MNNPNETDIVNRYTPHGRELYQCLKRALPWLGKMIADGGHLQSVSPREAEKVLANATLVIAKAEGRIAPDPLPESEQEARKRSANDFGFFVIVGRPYGADEAVTEVFGPMTVLEASAGFVEKYAPSPDDLEAMQAAEQNPDFCGVFIDSVIHCSTAPEIIS